MSHNSEFLFFKATNLHNIPPEKSRSFLDKASMEVPFLQSLQQLKLQTKKKKSANSCNDLFPTSPSAKAPLYLATKSLRSRLLFSFWHKGVTELQTFASWGTLKDNM